MLPPRIASANGGQNSARTATQGPKPSRRPANQPPPIRSAVQATMTTSRGRNVRGAMIGRRKGGYRNGRSGPFGASKAPGG